VTLKLRDMMGKLWQNTASVAAKSKGGGIRIASSSAPCSKKTFEAAQSEKHDERWNLRPI
jgi:hypothetical protein